MSLLSYHDLCDLINTGVIEGAEHDHVNSASIDLILGPDIMVETNPYLNGDPVVIDMLDKNARHLRKITMDEEGWIVPPGGVLLAETTNVFNLPNWLSGEYKLKSTMARNFFNHLNAGWADAGWNGSVLTLEFVNHLQFHSIRIKPGMKCGQMIFFAHEGVPNDRSYAARGQYNGDRGVTAGKGLK